MKSILINGHTYHEGDTVFADLASDHTAYECEDLINANIKYADCYWHVVRGIVNIQDENTFYICQNAVSGINNASNQYGKQYSWFATAHDGQISTCDTMNLKPLYEAKVLATISLDDFADDDPMPDDWQLPFSIPEYL